VRHANDRSAGYTGLVVAMSSRSGEIAARSVR